MENYQLIMFLQVDVSQVVAPPSFATFTPATEVRRSRRVQDKQVKIEVHFS